MQSSQVDQLCTLNSNGAIKHNGIHQPSQQFVTSSESMSYYLGKVGRAGARLVSSCKDLYYDVNAAYLTGAVDIIVIKQKDGSLKSSPFHVRFGKLGVLRTGDQKEVSR